MMSNFNHFLEKFPPVKLPITLSEEDAHVYSTENEPIPHKLIEEFIVPFETDHDEFTEYVPCFRIEGLKNFDAIVYWKAGLLNYQYIMMTFEKGGKTIDRKAVAGTYSDGQSMVRSVAQIEEDMSIIIMSGFSTDEDGIYDASLSTTKEIELLPDGKLVELD